MLDHLKKTLGLTETTSQVNTEEVANLTAQLQESQTIVAALTEQLNTNAKEMSTMAAKIKEFEQAFAESEAAKIEAEALEIEKKMTARKETIINAVGTIKADALFSATENLSDTEFTTIVDAMKTSLDIEADSFQEQGVAAGVDVETLETKPTHFNKNLRK